MKRTLWALLLLAAVTATFAVMTFTTLHPQPGETEKILLEKRVEALARLADALDGIGTNQLQAVQP